MTTDLTHTANRNMRYSCVTSGCYRDAHLPDWTPFNDCFEGNIRVSDIDGVVEIRGHLLILESKPPYAKIPEGQRRFLQSIAFNHGGTAIVMWGGVRTPERWQIWYPWETGARQAENCTLDMVKDRISRWYQWAKTTDYPPPKP